MLFKDADHVYENKHFNETDSSLVAHGVILNHVQL